MAFNQTVTLSPFLTLSSAHKKAQSMIPVVQLGMREVLKPAACHYPIFLLRLFNFV